MATQITNYQCPSCTGPLHYAGDSGNLECEFCGSAYSVEEIEAIYSAKDQAAAEAKTEADEAISGGESWDSSGLNEWGEEANGMKSYNCPSCGAELICDETTAATTCPYCGNPNIVPGQFSGALKPDFVIPFNLDKDAAVAALKKHYKGKFFLPKVFASQNQIKKIQGVYVPFWLYDGSAEGSVAYKASRSKTYVQGDYEITEVDHFVVDREGSISFEKVPVDASSKMPDDYMDSVEPFDYEGLKAFSNAYLAGYLADKYDVTIEESQERADKRCAQTLKDSLRNTVMGYSTVSEISSNIQLQRGKVHYALLPVWLLNTKWQNKDYLFAINGQTGKTVGDLPVDKGKYWGMFAGLSVGLTIISALLINLFA
ncbi:MAG: hypothetical protein IKV79_08490 [Oscillospiraceae bacterium]|nr:hypothetical protein [Oscillospiraceae bacterium]